MDRNAKRSGLTDPRFHVVSIFFTRPHAGRRRRNSPAFGTLAAKLASAASGRVLFAGNLVYAFADSGLAVTESNETNNVSRSGAGCAAEIPRGALDMAEEWGFTGSLVQPSFRNVTTTPVVGDLTGDGVADVVFVTFAGTNTAFGYLRAVDGATHQELFTADAFDWRVYGLATPGRRSTSSRWWMRERM